MSAEEFERLDDLRVRWIIHDELLLLHRYVQVHGLEDGLQQRLRDLDELLHPEREGE